VYQTRHNAFSSPQFWIGAQFGILMACQSLRKPVFRARVWAWRTTPPCWLPGAFWRGLSCPISAQASVWFTAWQGKAHRTCQGITPNFDWNSPACCPRARTGLTVARVAVRHPRPHQSRPPLQSSLSDDIGQCGAGRCCWHADPTLTMAIGKTGVV